MLLAKNASVKNFINNAVNNDFCKDFCFFYHQMFLFYFSTRDFNNSNFNSKYFCVNDFSSTCSCPEESLRCRL